MSQKILIIEDEPDIRKTLEYNISREGYEVISASSLSEGREKLESASFSLLLLDLMLPEPSGSTRTSTSRLRRARGEAGSEFVSSRACREGTFSRKKR